MPAGEVTRHHLAPSRAAIAALARSVASRMSASVRSQEPMPSSTEAILALLSHDSRTAETCAKRLAHSRLVMMMISSEDVIA